jgi:hypothetical protein
MPGFFMVRFLFSARIIGDIKEEKVASKQAQNGTRCFHLGQFKPEFLFYHMDHLTAPLPIRSIQYRLILWQCPKNRGGDDLASTMKSLRCIAVISKNRGGNTWDQ